MRVLILGSISLHWYIVVLSNAFRPVVARSRVHEAASTHATSSATGKLFQNYRLLGACSGILPAYLAVASGYTPFSTTPSLSKYLLSSRPASNQGPLTRGETLAGFALTRRHLFFFLFIHFYFILFYFCVIYDVTTLLNATIPSHMPRPVSSQCRGCLICGGLLESRFIFTPLRYPSASLACFT